MTRIAMEILRLFKYVISISSLAYQRCRKIIDIANAIDSSLKIKKIGIRLGEKLHEDLMTEAESSNTLELNDRYILLPFVEKKYIDHYKKISKKVKRLNNFSYSSNTNNEFLSVEQIKNILKLEKFI